MRHLILTLIAAVFAVAVNAAEMGDDGLHKADWMRDTFKDLQEDAAEAAAEGKRLLLIVEQRGCAYCQRMHEKTFPDPRIQAHLNKTYFPVQINLHGSTGIVDTDGKEISERDAARRWGVLFTPTMIYLPADIDTSKSVIEQAVATMPGAFSAGTTYDLMTWVAEERYLDQSEEDFQRYHARMIRERGDGDTE